MKVYLFGWPGTIGGASTKFAHLISLLARRFPITVVSLDQYDLSDTRWTAWLDYLEVPYCRFDDLPRRLSGWGVSLCNSEFIGSARWIELRRRGLKMAWGNEMMWPLRGETGAIALGQVDAILYVSPVQRAELEPHYERTLRGELDLPPAPGATRRITGWIRGGTTRERLRWVMVGNFIDSDAFPFLERDPEKTSGLVVGRLSRPDPTKFPKDFPRCYETLGLKRPRFRVMAWDAVMAAQWPGFAFGPRWELLPASADTPAFLQSLDLFVYELGPGCRESWGRSVVEAMLSGAVPIVPRGGGHHLDQLIEHGRSGFLCRNRADFRRFARYLQDNPRVRARVARQCREHAVRVLCNARQQLRRWERVFHGA